MQGPDKREELIRKVITINLTKGSSEKRHNSVKLDSVRLLGEASGTRRVLSLSLSLKLIAFQTKTVLLLDSHMY